MLTCNKWEVVFEPHYEFKEEKEAHSLEYEDLVIPALVNMHPISDTNKNTEQSVILNWHSA
jgi:hypothetical protein